MTTTPFSRLTLWARRGVWGGLLAAAALPLLGFLADLGWGAEVLLIAPHEPPIVELNRSLWSLGDPVADLYGSPMSAPTRVLLVRSDAVIHPEEDSSLALLAVGGAHDRPIQTRTLWWAIRLVEVALAAATVFLFALASYARSRERAIGAV